MADRTPTQEASHQMAEAVFNDPALRQRFEQMAKETAEREPVPDDFAWLSPLAVSTEYDRFEAFTKRLVAVPKREIDAERVKDSEKS